MAVAPLLQVGIGGEAVKGAVEAIVLLVSWRRGAYRQTVVEASYSAMVEFVHQLPAELLLVVHDKAVPRLVPGDYGVVSYIAEKPWVSARGCSYL